MTARRLCLSLAASSFLLIPSTATAARKSTAKVDKKAPVVTNVTPKSAKVGDVLVVTGRNFARGTGKNQVFFYAAKGGGTWATADEASATRLNVRVPDKLATLLPANGDDARIRLRIKSKRLGGLSSPGVSPLIAVNASPAGGGAGATTAPACLPNFNDPNSDVDRDLLPDVRERDLLLDPCNRDSDGDQVSDGYEYYSALDLNSSARPYPGKRPFPNALQKDANHDYDGDGLTLLDEYSLWTKFGQSQLPLNYSDGKQVTVSTPAPGGSLYYLDIRKDGILSDDERDADGDGLGNWDESHGRMTTAWWKSKYDGSNDTLETAYPEVYGGVDMLDADSDGDGVPDGADDNDYDGLTNAFEIERPANWKSSYVAVGRGWDNTAKVLTDPDGAGPLTVSDLRYYSRVQPFNPCKPVWSQKCHIHYPFGYYPLDELWAPADVFPAPGAKPGDV